MLDEIGTVAAIAFSTLETNNNAMGKQMMKSKKNSLTPLIKETAKDRKSRWSEVTRNTTTALEGRDPVKKESARLLKLFLGPCWKVNAKPVNIQTTLLFELFRLYNNNADMQQHAANVGVDGMLRELEPVNLNYQKLSQTRASQKATQRTSASSLKDSVVDSYDDFCDDIERAVKYTPSPALIRLFDQIDALRKEYAHFAAYKDVPKVEEPKPAQPE
jgi:hypothetical protein